MVYRSGLLFEADIVADALERAGIPYFRREESSSGLSFAMPVAPVSGPGVTWAIVVPVRARARARNVIATLPVSKDPEPGVWGFRPTPAARLFFKQYAWLYLLAVLVALIFSVIQLFR